MKPNQNLESLIKKRNELLAECKIRESGLNARIVYIEDNFGRLLFSSISPFNGKTTEKVDEGLNVVNDVLAAALPSLGLNKEKTGKIAKIAQMILIRFAYKKIREAIVKLTTEKT